MTQVLDIFNAFKIVLITKQIKSNLKKKVTFNKKF